MWRGCMAPVKTPRRRGAGPALRLGTGSSPPCGAHQPRRQPVALSCGACRRACPALGYQSGAAGGLFRSRIRYSQRRPIARASNGVGCRHRPLRRPVARHGGALAGGARGARAGHLVARANLPRFRIRLKLPCALKGSYYPGSLGGEPWRSVFGLCLFFTRRILNILSLFNKRVRSPKQLCSVADTTQHPDLIQVVECFTSPHDRS